MALDRGVRGSTESLGGVRSAMPVNIVKRTRADLLEERRKILAYLGVRLKEAYALEDQWWIDGRHQDAVHRLRDIAFLLKQS